MKTLIIYDSKYGTTQTYAEMINRHLAAQIKSIKETTEADLQNAEIVIIGTYVRV
jgi:menaquinone-dependent protoporphyrinogen IX oxidase